MVAGSSRGSSVVDPKAAGGPIAIPAINLTLKVYANCDHTYLVWKASDHIAGCRGFAIYRRRDGEDELLDTYVGFAGETAAPGTLKPSNNWPVQKFMWSDYMVWPGDVVQYRVVPVAGPDKDHLVEQPGHASEWSPAVSVTADTDSSTHAYFNRGVVAAQWLARRLGRPEDAANKLETIIATPGDPTREELGGELMSAMQVLLQEAAQGSNQLYCVLFELNDPDLLGRLLSIGERANVVLANGSPQPPQTDENKSARQALSAKGVRVYDRMVPKGSLAHNKFAVICNGQREPLKAWSGSTNWTMTGLCTQSNNGIMFTNPEIARLYLDQWDRLKFAGNEFPPELVSANDTLKTAAYDDRKVSIWFTRVNDQFDLVDAKKHIDEATQGILFLMFNPGPSGTLLNFIIERNDATSPSYDPHLYTHGVLNQDPSTHKNPIHLFNRGQENRADFEIALPAAVTQQLNYWRKELLKLPSAHALVHSKTIVIDAFGRKPVVMTGSHNMGPRASTVNDDNLVIIENDPSLAEAYAVYIMGVFDQYWWRFRTNQSGQLQWNGLVDNDAWQDSYLSGPRLHELKFWLGEE